MDNQKAFPQEQPQQAAPAETPNPQLALFWRNYNFLRSRQGLTHGQVTSALSFKRGYLAKCASTNVELGLTRAKSIADFFMVDINMMLTRDLADLSRRNISITSLAFVTRLKEDTKLGIERWKTILRQDINAALIGQEYPWYDEDYEKACKLREFITSNGFTCLSEDETGVTSTNENYTHSVMCTEIKYHSRPQFGSVSFRIDSNGTKDWYYCYSRQLLENLQVTYCKPENEPVRIELFLGGDSVVAASETSDNPIFQELEALYSAIHDSLQNELSFLPLAAQGKIRNYLSK